MAKTKLTLKQKRALLSKGRKNLAMSRVGKGSTIILHRRTTRSTAMARTKGRRR